MLVGVQIATLTLKSNFTSRCELPVLNNSTSKVYAQDEHVQKKKKDEHVHGSIGKRINY